MFRLFSVSYTHLDVYKRQAFAGMLDYIRTGKVPSGSTVVFWHTGGATALFAEKEILGALV